MGRRGHVYGCPRCYYAKTYVGLYTAEEKLENLRNWRNMNSGEIGGAFKYRNSAKVHYAQTEEEIKRIMEENENGL